jgi:hypothetical protein
VPSRRCSDRSRRTCVLLALLISLASAVAAAQDAAADRIGSAGTEPPATAPDEPWRTDRIYLETSLNNTHFHYNPEHVSYPKLVYGEYHMSDGWLVGAAAFDNSFGQASQAVFGGWRYRPLAGLQPLYLKVVAGIVHGYRGQYRDKIPLNHSGFAPAVIPSLGYCFSRVCSEVVVIGGAGLLFTFGVTIP